MDISFLTTAESHLIAPSFLAANFLHIADEIDWLEQPAVDLIHFDVMDGQFVPNISFGMPILKAVSGKSSKKLDVHLMIERPEQFISAFKEAGADIITVHMEACQHLHRTINQINETGALAGVALNPHTTVATLDDVLDQLDLALIMSVNPGFGGQKFIDRSLHKIEQLKNIIVSRGLHCKIEVDGGVHVDNAPRLLSAGADILVAGSAIFGSEDRDETLQTLKNLSV